MMLVFRRHRHVEIIGYGNMLQETIEKFDPKHLTAERVLESLQHPILIVDRNSVIVYANAYAATGLGGWIVDPR